MLVVRVRVMVKCCVVRVMVMVKCCVVRVMVKCCVVRSGTVHVLILVPCLQGLLCDSAEDHHSSAPFLKETITWMCSLDLPNKESLAVKMFPLCTHPVVGKCHTVCVLVCWCPHSML